MPDGAPKLVVVGGVAAGMSSATRARRLHETAPITVFEKDRYVSFANCGLPYHLSGEIRRRDELLVVTAQDLAQRLALQIHTEHEVTGIDRRRHTVAVTDRCSGRRFEEPYDKLILATGAQPVRPPLPGIDHPRIFTLRNILDMDAIKAALDAGAAQAVVVGGGYIGVETAEALRRRGLEVMVVELGEQLMSNFDPEMARDLALHLETHGIRLFLRTRVNGFADAGGRIQVLLSEGGPLTADLVVLAIGVRPDSRLARDAGLAMGERGGIQVDQQMRTSDPDIFAVGDVVEVRDAITGAWTLIPLAGPANRQGRVAADAIFGRPARYRATQGSAVIRVFDMTAASTGANERTLRSAAIPWRKAYLHPNGHAAYYPGTHPMHLKVLFAPTDGRLLGAQAVGFDGVDKRMDVLATALHAGMTVFDLEELELAYAPPYGSAKDPVNMAGFVAANMLRGDAAAWYAEEWPEIAREGGILLDVRTPKEFALWHIPGALHIPINELRSRIHELEAHREGRLYVYCLSGFRSYLATRQLRQRGFRHVYNLSGGVKTFLAYHHEPIASAQPGQPWISYAEGRAGTPGIPLT